MRFRARQKCSKKLSFILPRTDSSLEPLWLSLRRTHPFMRVLSWAGSMPVGTPMPNRLEDTQKLPKLAMGVQSFI